MTNAGVVLEQKDVVVANLSIATVLDEKSLQTLGVSQDDFPAVREIANRIEVDNPLSVSEFGREVSDHTSGYADGILDQVRNRDLDDAGAKLTQVVSIARGLNMNALTDRRSKIPLIGTFIDKFKLSSKNFMGEFQTTKEQIENLITEVEVSQKGLASRNLALEEMFSAVKSEHHMLGVHIAAGKLRLEELKLHAEDMRKTVNAPAQLQELADLDAMCANLDKRIGDLQVLQHSALQSLPMIRLIQSNNKLLVDKFYTITQITVPAWKRQFLLSLSINEQANAVQLADQIDDTTNDLMRRNAELLHKSSVDTAKSNQRLVIDIGTLQDVQNKLIQTVEDVIKINRDGVAERAKVEKEIIAMRDNLKTRLIRNGEPEKTSKEVA